MRRFRNLLLISTCFACGPALADLFDVTGQIVTEDGKQIRSLVVRLDGRRLDTDAAGRFEFSMDADSSAPLRVEVSADDYYSTLQTLQRRDFVSGKPAVLPAIELIRKKTGRRLLMFAGDAMLSRRYFSPRAGEPVLIRESHIEEDSRALLQYIKPYIELADYASVNMETQLSSRPLTEGLPKSVTFYSPPELAETLQWAGFNYTALGNNHMYDYQEEGLRSTFEVLDRLQLDYSGGGFDDVEARRPAAVEIGGQAHAFLSYVGWAGTFRPSQVAEESKGGAALGDSKTLAEDLSRSSGQVTAVVQMHAGLEYSERPALSEQTMYRQAIRDGADLVVGHHPHVLQGFEIVDNRLIAYSMGNFLFDQYHYTTQLGMLLYVWMDGDELHRAELVPLHINGYVPTPATGAFRFSVLQRLARLSDPGSVCMRPNGLHAMLEACPEDGRIQAQQVHTGDSSEMTLPLALRDRGVSPLAPIDIVDADFPYRLGVDILRRGDFEYAGLFGTKDRTWIEDERTSITQGENASLRVEVTAGDAPVQTGLKVFERVFTRSNPATVSGRVKVNGNIRMRVFLQRRRTTDALQDALDQGALIEIATASFESPGWHEFAFDYRQPRIETRSVRLLFEVEDVSGNGAVAELDDIAWIEWSTPWIRPDDRVLPTYATHLQFQK